MSECIFCKIAAGEIPAEVVHEDEKTLAFKDINPKAPVHVLLVPKRHIATLNDAESGDAGLLGHLMLAAAEVARRLGVAQSGYRVLANCNRDGGQEVFHLHLHLMGGRRLGGMG